VVLFPTIREIYLSQSNRC